VGLFIFVVFDSLSTCKVIRAKVPHMVFEAEKRVRDGLDVPNYEESSMRRAAVTLPFDLHRPAEFSYNRIVQLRLFLDQSSGCDAEMTHDYRLAREKMVNNQLISRGITDEGVLRAMGKIHRHLFVEEALIGEAYNDHPLPIGHKQTISQPYIVALMTEALVLTGNEKTLEIGTGSGYQTAILAELSKAVYTVERIGPLLEKAKALLGQLGYVNIYFKIFDGTLGWEDFAPFDAIIVTAGAPKIPQPILDQLTEGGRLVIPIGNRYSQDLIKVKRIKNTFKEENLGGCRFVDLIGVHGWKE
jgi:protein-L-isoaspartate(D-aspartate) O-methyltransferase